MALVVAGCGSHRQQAIQLADQAQQQFDAGQLTAAAETIEAAIRKQDDVADFYMLKARIALADNRLPDVLRAYTLATELEPANVDALRGLAQISYRLGRTEDAERAIRQLLAQSPAEPTARLIKGLIALNRCRSQAALDLAQQILANNPADEGGLTLRARALFALNRVPEARKTLEDAIRQLGPTYGLLLTRLDMDLSAADVTALKADYVAIRRLQPREPELALQQVNFLYKAGDVAAARLAGSALVRSGNLAGDGVGRLAQIWREYDGSPLGTADLAALAANGARPARIMVAQHYLEVGQAVPAVKVLSGIEGSDVSGLLARAQLVLARPAEAEAAAQAVLQRDKTQCDALLALARLRLDAGRRDEASARAQEAAAECPGQWLAYVVQADANAGSATQLDRITAAALDANPQNAPLARALASRWRAIREPRRAIAVATRLTRSAPALVGGWTLLGELCHSTGNPTCFADSDRGRRRALTLYQLDPAPGERPLLGGRGIGCRGLDGQQGG